MKNLTSTFAASLLAIAVLLPLSAQAEEATPNINVSGVGHVSAAPDKAMISVSIEARRKRIQEARDEVSSVIGRTLSVTDSLNIDRKYINTSASTIRPEYRYNNSKRIFDGYYVSRQVIIDLRELDKIGPLTEKLLDAGINNVSPPSLGSTKAAELKREALKRATEDAKLNASVIADSLGVSVGKPLSISANSNNHYPRPQRMMMKAAYADAAEAAPSETYETGEIRFSANVNARFEIK
ncbi:MAG: SIMPL domain-containing protein [Gammaproteobacteria bacterium]|nr:SIMPL domain-containing protein [Gammaproteobacteria bacterium]